MAKLISQKEQNLRVEEGLERIIEVLKEENAPVPIDRLLEVAVKRVKRAVMIPSDLRVSLSEGEMDGKLHLDHYEGVAFLANVDRRTEQRYSIFDDVLQTHDGSLPMDEFFTVSSYELGEPAEQLVGAFLRGVAKKKYIIDYVHATVRAGE
jgi:hypothetical protein